MTREEMKKRIKAFALRCAKPAGSFPRSATGDVIARQLIKTGTSVAANYRAVCSARSHADFVNKLGIVEEETDESVFWIDFAADAGLARRPLVADLLRQGQEILAIIVASQKTAKSGRRKTARAKRTTPKE